MTAAAAVMRMARRPKERAGRAAGCADAEAEWASPGARAGRRTLQRSTASAASADGGREVLRGGTDSKTASTTGKSMAGQPSALPEEGFCFPEGERLGDTISGRISGEGPLLSRAPGASAFLRLA